MADQQTLQRFSELLSLSYVPSVGGWVQVVPDAGITTVLNAFNTLGTQTLELYLLNQAGDLVASEELTLASYQALRLDLETLIPAGSLPFEGSVWLWCKGATGEGSIGLQAVDLDFIDRNRPAGYVAGSVHLMFDFLNTLLVPPYLDLVTPRVLAERTAEGSSRYQNYIGMAQVPIYDYSTPSLDLKLSNEAGETLTADPISLPVLGSYFGSLEVLFPDLADFLIPSGATRGYGALGVRDGGSDRNGLVAMLKVVDVVSGELLVDHLNDRSFARPAQKES